MASTTSDENGAGKESTGDTGLDERSENNEGVDYSEESSEEDIEEHEDEALPSLEESKNGNKKENDVQIKNTKDKTKGDETQCPQSKLGLGDICNSVVLLIGCAIACLLLAICISSPEPGKKGDFDLVKIFGNGVDQLQLSFTNQTERFWKILKNRGLAHLRNNNPSQPLVFLLAAPPPAHEWVDCLATKLAEMLDPRHKRNFASIDGADEERYPGDKVKKKMDDYLKETFKDDERRVAVIYHLELLPPPSPLLFYSYCDDQNAPHKHIAIIFTVHLPEDPSLSLSPKEAEATVEKYLSKQVWLRDDPDAVAALLSRIANTVALMNGESNDSLKAYCS